jgi:hypothetical protein
MTPDEEAKWNKFLADYDPNTASTMYATHSVAQHFVENEILIAKDAQNEIQRNLPKWRPDNDNEDEIREYLFEQDQARLLHDETLIPMHRYSCIVMLYIVVERELRRLVDNLQVVQQQKLKVKDLKGSYFEQTKKFLDVFYNLDISQCPNYGAVEDLRRIRNCIVHCQGELALCSKDEQKYLAKLQIKYKDGFFAHPKSDIKIERVCIRNLLKRMVEFFIWVFEKLQQVQPVEKLNWKVNPSAEVQRLEKILGRIG